MAKKSGQANGVTSTDISQHIHDVNKGSAQSMRLIVYPNPKTRDEQLFIEAYNLEPKEKVTLTVYNILGKEMVVSHTVSDQNGYAKVKLLDSQNLKKGIYIVRADGTTGKVQAKFLVR